MAGRMLEMAIAIKGRLEKSYTDSMRRAIASAENVQKKMSRISQAMAGAQKSASLLGRAESELAAKFMQLKSVQKAADDFRKLKLASQTTAQELTAAQAKVAALAQAMRSASAPTRQMQQQFDQARAKAAALKAQLASQQAGLQGLRSTLSAAGFSTRDFAASEARLRQEMDRTTAAIARQNQQRQNLNAARSQRDAASQNMYNAYGNMQGAIGTAQTIMSPFVGAIEGAMEFEHAMSRLKSLTQMDFINSGNIAAAESNMKSLREQAEMLGATTQYTMKQAADAQIFYAKAGWETEKIMAAMPPTLAMAAAAGEDLAASADMVSDIMGAFGASADEAGHYTDAFAYTLVHSNQNLQEMKDALKYAAPVAKQFGVSMEETATMTKFMADAGIKGTMAGTSMRMSMLRLVAPPKKASKAMEELGISVSDAQAAWQESQATMKAYGITVDESLPPGEKMIAIISQMEEKMAGLSESEKLAAFSAITGVNAVSGWANVAAAGSKKMKGFTDALRNCDGYAAQTAAVMNDDATGAAIALNSAIDALQKSVGNAFLSAVKDAAQYVTPLVTQLAQWISANPNIVKGIGAIAAVASAAIVAISGIALAFASFNFITAQITAMKAAFTGLNAVARLSALIMGGFSLPVIAAIIAVIAVIALLAANWEYVKETAEIVWNHISGTISAQVERIKAALAGALDKITAVWNSVTGQSIGSAQLVMAVINNVGFVIGAAFDIAAGIVGTAISLIINYVVAFAQIVGGVVNIIVGLFTGDLDRAIGGAKQAFEGLYSGTIGQLKELASGVGSIFDTLMGKADEVESKAKAAQSSLAGSQMSGADAMRGLREAGTDPQAVADAQQMASAAADASASAQTYATNMQQAGANTQQTSEYMQQLQQITQNMPTGAQDMLATLGTDSGAAVQTVQTNLAQLPPIAQTNTDSMVNELSQLATKSQPGGDAFVQAANNWGQQAYDNIAQWSEQMANVVNERLSAAWSQISAQFSAGLHVNVTTSSTPVAQNATGGIYGRGAFLTTFAEDGPEAAIPLDGSSNAIGLWQRAGEMLGLLPQAGRKSVLSLSRSTAGSGFSWPNEISGNSNSIEINMPSITINGNADAGTVGQIEDVLARAKAEIMREVERKFPELLAGNAHYGRRTSYA